jgi:hypothetical protein
MRGKPGFVVVIEDGTGRTGRTFHSKGFVNGKMPVYLESKPMACDYSSTATLFDPKIVKRIGLID